jgi:hypothetical protein
MYRRVVSIHYQSVEIKTTDNIRQVMWTSMWWKSAVSSVIEAVQAHPFKHSNLAHLQLIKSRRPILSGGTIIQLFRPYVYSLNVISINQNFLSFQRILIIVERLKLCFAPQEAHVACSNCFSQVSKVSEKENAWPRVNPRPFFELFPHSIAFSTHPLFFNLTERWRI